MYFIYLFIYSIKYITIYFLKITSYDIKAIVGPVMHSLKPVAKLPLT